MALRAAPDVPTLSRPAADLLLNRIYPILHPGTTLLHVHMWQDPRHLKRTV